MAVPYFNEKQQNRAYSYVEFMAYVILEYRGNMGAAFKAYPVSLKMHDLWLKRFEIAKGKGVNAKSVWGKLAQLYDDLIARRFASLDEFYVAFNRIKHPKKGAALAQDKARTAKRIATAASKGEAFIDNNILLNRMYRLANVSIHKGLEPAELEQGLDDLIAKYHRKPLTADQREWLRERMNKRMNDLEQQVTPVEVELLQAAQESQDKASRNTIANALLLYVAIKSFVLVGEQTPPLNVRQWAERVPFGRDQVMKAMAVLVSRQVVSVIQEPTNKIPKGSKQQNQAGVWQRLR